MSSNKYSRYQWQMLLQERKRTWTRRTRLFTTVVPIFIFIGLIISSLTLVKQITDIQNTASVTPLLTILILIYFLLWIWYLAFTLSLSPYELETIFPTSFITKPHQHQSVAFFRQATICILSILLLLSQIETYARLTIAISFIILHSFAFVIPLYLINSWIQDNRPYEKDNDNTLYNDIVYILSKHLGKQRYYAEDTHYSQQQRRGR